MERNVLKKKRKMRVLRVNEGFTLIEMAIVLIIIGLIIGAVMKGPDLIKSAQIKNAYQTFFAAHYKLIGSYYDKTGRILGDGKVNGGRYSASDGFMDGFWLGSTERKNVITALKSVGIDACSLIKSNLTADECGKSGPNIGQISVNGEYTTVTATIGFLSPVIDNRRRNAVTISLLPTDFAIAMDTMIDGTPNCNAGSFVCPSACKEDGKWPDASATPTVRSVYWITEF